MEDIVKAELLDAVVQEQDEQILEEEPEERPRAAESSKSSHSRPAPSVDNLFDDDDVVEEVRPSRYRAKDPSPPPSPTPASKKGALSRFSTCFIVYF